MDTIRAKSWILALGLVGSLFAAPVTASPITLIPGTILGVDSVFPSMTGTLVQFSTSGTQINHLDLHFDFHDFMVFRGLTILGDNVYVTDGGTVGLVDLTTGEVTAKFDLTVFNNEIGTEALGDNGTDLLVAGWGNGLVYTYTTDGVQVGGARPNIFQIQGLDGDTAGNLYTAKHFGNIEVYNSHNMLVQTIVTGLPRDALTGLGYDPFTNSVWVADSVNHDILRFSLASGTMTGSFDVGASVINGLDIVPVPETSSLLLLATGLGPLLGYGWRRKRAA
jgi:hypothetical protein